MDPTVFHGVGVAVVTSDDNKIRAIALTDEGNPSIVGDDSSGQFDIEVSKCDVVWIDKSMPRGRAYIEHVDYDTLKESGKIPDPEYAGQWPPSGWPLGAYTSIVYNDNNTYRRYHGYRAEILSKLPDPNMFRVRIHTALQSLEKDISLSTPAILAVPPATAYSDTPNITILNDGAPMNTPGLLFIESQYAHDTLLLGDPKLPIGLCSDWEFGNLQRVDCPPAPASASRTPSLPTRTQRISISLARSDGILQQVLNNIDGEARVSGVMPSRSLDREQPTVWSAVESRRKAGLPLTIDLIAHASQGILQFGTWKVTGNDQACIALRDAWMRDAPRGIRLLGCSTAGTPTGHEAMQRLKQVFREVQPDVRVYGAITALLAGDFEASGFWRDDLLVEVDQLSPCAVRPTPDQIVGNWFRRFPQISDDPKSIGSLLFETRSEAEGASVAPVVDVGAKQAAAMQAPPTPTIVDLIKTLEPSVHIAPGLLASSDVEWLYPAGENMKEEPVFHRVSSFLGGAFVRVYPQAHPSGVLLKRGASASR